MSEEFTFPPSQPSQPQAHVPPQPAYGYAPPPPPGYGYVPPPPRPRRSGLFWLLAIGGGALAFCLFIGLVIWGITAAVSGDTGSLGGDKIGVIDVDGVITTADQVDEPLRKLADQDDVKAIVLHINSPGGGAAASQEIYNEVIRIRREKHKKVVASIESMGASGAYYISSACDKIYANDASVVGSIGVIMEWTNYGELMQWAKLKNVTLKAGKLKDAGSPTRDLTPEEQAYFQSLVDNMHEQFIHDVATGRGVPESKIKPLATGQVWTGQQAKPLGLIDVEGGFRNALIDTARDAGIRGEPNIVRPPKPKRGLLSMLAGDDADDLFPSVGKLLNQAPGFYYMWK